MITEKNSTLIYLHFKFTYLILEFKVNCKIKLKSTEINLKSTEIKLKSIEIKLKSIKINLKWIESESAISGYLSEFKVNLNQS